MADDFQIDVWTVDRKTDERVVVAVRRTRWYLDVRVQFRDFTGAWKPTQKGVAFKPSQLVGFLDALNKAIEILRTRVPAETDSRTAGAE